MDRVTVKVVAAEGAAMPFQATAGAAGADLCAYLPAGPLEVPGGGYLVVPTGLVVEIPAGFEGQVRPRSGLAARHGVTVLNSPGTIDADYRGEVKVVLMNHGTCPFVVHHGDRIAQLVIAEVVSCSFEQVGKVCPTERGGGGFGSTGV